MAHKHPWRIAAATAPGTSHLRRNTPNQDAVVHQLINTSQSQVAIIAVADGAGSASRSNEGSQIAAQTAVNTMARGIAKRPATAVSKPMSTSLVRNSVKHAKNAVVRYAKEQDIRPRDLASTLIVVMASERLLTAAQIGDGAVVAFNTEDETARTLCHSHTGEHANETTFIVSRSRPHKLAHVGHGDTAEFNTVALVTDGLENLALNMPEREPFYPFWKPMLTDLSQSEHQESVSKNMLAFINSGRVRERTADDLTIAMAMQMNQKHQTEEARPCTTT